MIDVFLAGEGPNELGGWCKDPVYRAEAPTPGVLEALARHIVPSGWQVKDAIQWKNIPKLGLGSKGKGVERKAILAAHLHAKECNCAVLLFSRDRDGKRNHARQSEVDAAIAELEGGPTIAGSVCVERLESWLLALTGRTKTEETGDAKTDEELATHGVAAKHTRSMVEHVQRHGMAKVPADAYSLHAFRSRVTACLTPTEPAP